MNSAYEALNREIVTGITAQLLSVDQLPPSTEVATLARGIADLVFKKLSAVGLTADKIESIASTSNLATAAKAPTG